MSLALVAAGAVAASLLAWAAIFAASRLDLQRWVWLPAFRAGAAASLAATGLLLLAAPVPPWAPLALSAAGLAAGLVGALAQRDAARPGGAS